MMFNVTMSNMPTYLASHHLGDAGTAGAVIATTMVGGAFSGFFFNRLTRKLGDYLIPFSFSMFFIGFTMLNLFSASLPVVFVAVFIVGTSGSLCPAQCIFSSSRVLDPTNSAVAATFLSSVAPGSGGFLSPIIFTNITQALVPDSTAFRYQFVGVAALVVAAVFLFLIRRRRSKTASVS